MNDCPYCGTEMQGVTDGPNQATDDHIIPQFLSGARTIRACRRCNSTFGHTFEGPASKLLVRLYVQLAIWGVPMPATTQWWRDAYAADGTTIDLSVGSQGIDARWIKPIILRDAANRIDEAYFPREPDVRKFVYTMGEREPGSQWIPAEKRIGTNLSGLRLQVEIGPILQQMALKMCTAASTLLPHISKPDLVAAGETLRADPASPHPLVSHYFLRYANIENARPHLAHTVYVEHIGDRLWGVVQLFGVCQLFGYISTATQLAGNHAILGWADPVSSTEVFQNVEPIGLTAPPQGYWSSEIVRAQLDWVARLYHGAVQRGATVRPEVLIRARVPSRGVVG